MARGGILVALLICAVVALGAWVRLGQPVAVADAPVTRAWCVSYAPFQGSETPFDETFVVPPERIANDLKQLSSFTDCVRTYASTNGLDAVAAAAEPLGMTVIQGLWIGAEDARNRAELERVVALAQAHPETITAVIVGNEALLRQEITADRLAPLMAEVGARIDQPVTYADVWEFWERNAAALTPHADFVTVHLLPYWEDDPAGIDEALAHVAAIHERMERVFPGKDVVIGEIGWPSAGRQREDAEPGLVQQTRFIRGVLDLAHRRGWHANLIESFDQPWKRALEGTAGGFWGLFGDDRQPKVTLTGPVVEVPGWQGWLGAAAGLGLALAALALVPAGRRDPLALGIAVAGGLATGGTLAFVARHTWMSSRTPVEWAVNGGLCLAVAAAGMVFTALLRDPDGPCAARLSRVASVLRRVALVVAAVGAVGLTFDGRYRDFPATMIVVPAVAVVLLALARRRVEPLPRVPEDPWLAVVVALGALIVPVLEGLANDDALAWAVVALVLAVPALPLVRPPVTPARS